MENSCIDIIQCTLIADVKTSIDVVNANVTQMMLNFDAYNTNIIELMNILKTVSIGLFVLMAMGFVFYVFGSVVRK